MLLLTSNFSENRTNNSSSYITRLNYFFSQEANFYISMIIEIALSDSQKEWCILEFQGEILGDLEENTLGEIEIKNVSISIGYD